MHHKVLSVFYPITNILQLNTDSTIEFTLSQFGYDRRSDMVQLLNILKLTHICASVKRIESDRLLWQNAVLQKRKIHILPNFFQFRHFGLFFVCYCCNDGYIIVEIWHSTSIFLVHHFYRVGALTTQAWEWVNSIAELVNWECSFINR